MAISIPRRRGGTWEGVPVVTWFSEWICRMRGGLVHHTIMNPVALSLPLLRSACSRSCTDKISKSLVLYQNLQFFPAIVSICQNYFTYRAVQIFKIILRKFLFYRIWSSAQDHAFLVLFLNLVGVFIFKRQNLCGNDFQFLLVDQPTGSGLAA